MSRQATMNKTKTLYEIFDVEPEEGVLVEFENGVKVLPILECKKMLHSDFHKWSTNNFNSYYYQRGHDTYFSCSVELNLWLPIDGQMHHFTFVGSVSFNTKNYETLSQGEVNENHAATGLSLATVNAASNIGKKFGLGMNSKRLIDHTPETQEKKTRRPSMKKSIDSIVNKTE